MTIVAVFKSRAQALDCVSNLRREGIPAQTVSNPHEAGVGCGISVRFEENFLPRARRCLSRKNYSAFAGYMKQTQFGSSWLP